MDITETRHPQDGRFSVSVAGRKIDLRVAIFPVAYGECVAIRLLDQANSLLKIEELGFSPDMCARFQKFISKPHGIILVTGPTGSGKSSTLYAALNKVSSPEKNIFTIEDPIEYLLENVNQAQVNPKTGIDFATALRSFLRQDPDVILVGEIRDAETAKMAFRAALTGHLVFSTLHTNDAPTAILRLKDLGVDRDTLSSSLICVLAQRLVRHICPSCKKQYQPEQQLFGLANELDTNAKFYIGKGCEDCHHTGYKGRDAIFELLENTPEIGNLILKDAPLEEIKKTALGAGMKTLLQDGIEKVKKGMTTIEEVLRVTQE
jgi:type IV pilus assembly protein PilB